MRQSTILVALSGEDFQEKIIQKTVALANGKDITLVFLHVIKELGLELFRLKDMIDTQKLKERLTATIQSYRPTVPFEVDVAFGSDPSSVILKQAEVHQAQMIVVGSNEKSPGLGSIARKVLQHSYLPVFVVKNEHTHGMKLLHALDMRNEVLEINCEICDRLLQGYEQHYLYAYDGVKNLAYKYQNVAIYQAGDFHSRVAAGLEEARSRFSRIHPDAILDVMEIHEDASSEIVSYAKNKGYNLIMMTSKHSGGLSSIIFGSVAAKVAKMSEADLLVTYDK